jgi:hypothetical protein
MLVLLLPAALAGVLAQEVPPPLASFTGTVRTIDSHVLTLARQGQDDLEINCTHKTCYYSGAKKIKREAIKPGDRISVETTLDPYLKPEAVTVRLLTPEKAP